MSANILQDMITDPLNTRVVESSDVAKSLIYMFKNQPVEGTLELPFKNINENSPTTFLFIDAQTQLINTLLSIIQGVAQNKDVDLATGAALTALGEEKGVLRNPNESDDNFRSRIYQQIGTAKVTVDSFENIKKILDITEYSLYTPTKIIKFLNNSDGNNQIVIYSPTLNYETFQESIDPDTGEVSEEFLNKIRIITNFLKTTGAAGVGFIILPKIGIDGIQLSDSDITHYTDTYIRDGYATQYTIHFAKTLKYSAECKVVYYNAATKLTITEALEKQISESIREFLKIGEDLSFSSIASKTQKIIEDFYKSITIIRVDVTIKDEAGIEITPDANNTIFVKLDNRVTLDSIVFSTLEVI